MALKISLIKCNSQDVVNAVSSNIKNNGARRVCFRGIVELVSGGKSAIVKVEAEGKIYSIRIEELY
ncbi:MAG: hypothetical protein DRJ52_01525 [Thermoprotei archaeon]|nr:MAG: hypothetical protein DRJ52_01525 [Thermoprotei archaeon]RLF00162.1 MAG: hypothetical protein DRJ63_03345 [Thermoprotei archaeon]HDI74992.1 hypothetical protein [Thermoprotei archaeon]